MLLAAALLASVCSLATTASANPIAFADDFNDGDAAGWWLGHVSQAPGVGNWRVENGSLVQDAPGDAFIALVQNIELSSQFLSADIFPYQIAGYAGFTFWYRDPLNYASIVLYPGPGVCIGETVNGAPVTSSCIPYFLSQATTHGLMVDVDALSGSIAIFVDNSFVTIFQANTATRSGRSGLYDGNSGAAFDNFRLAGDGTSTVPEPASLLLLATALAGVVARRRWQDSRRSLESKGP